MTSWTGTRSKSSEPAAHRDAGRSRPLIHPVSAVLLLVIDGLWTFADWAALAWAITIPLSFLAVSLPVYAIQRHVNRDGGGKSLAIAAALGMLAAVPTPVTGTFVGTVILLLAGLRSLRGA